MLTLPNWGGKMTYAEYLESVMRYRAGTNLRRGQAAFNMLHDHRPDLAEMVQSTDLDPYYLDARLPAFYSFVGENW